MISNSLNKTQFNIDGNHPLIHDNRKKMQTQNRYIIEEVAWNEDNLTLQFRS